MWSRRTGRFSFNRIAASDFSATMPSHHLSLIWHRAIFSAIPWLNFWHPSYKSIVPFTCCRKIPINTYLILFVGFRDVDNLQSVVDAMNLHWDTKRYFWQKCLFSRPCDLHREIKKDYALCSTRTKTLKDSELNLAVAVSNLTFWLTRTSQIMMHQYKRLSQM